MAVTDGADGIVGPCHHGTQCVGTAARQRVSPPRQNREREGAMIYIRSGTMEKVSKTKSGDDYCDVGIKIITYCVAFLEMICAVMLGRGESSDATELSELGSNSGILTRF